MSLLLDALHRASKDKEKAALAAATAAAQADGAPLTQPPRPSPADSRPLSLTDESLPELSTQTATEPSPQPITLAVDPKELALEIELQPVVTPPPERVEPVEVPLAEAGAGRNAGNSNGIQSATQATGPNVGPVFSAPSAPSPNTQAAAKAIQNAYAVPRPRTTQRHRRVLILGGVAACMALGLGSFLFGLWGDPEQLLGLTGTSSVAATSPPAPVSEPLPAAIDASMETAAAAPAEASVAIPAAVPETTAVPANTAVVHHAEKPAPIPTPAPTVFAKTATTRSPMVAKRPTSQPEEVVLSPPSRTPVFASRGSNQSSLERGYTALVEGRLDDAVRAYDAALAVNPSERDALLGLAYVAHTRGRREEAQVLYRKVLRQDPSNSVANAGLIALDAGANSASKGDRAKALAAAQPDSAATQALAGSVLAQEGLTAEAALAFSRAQRLEPTNPWHSFNLAVALDKLGNYAQATEQYDKALQNKDRSPTHLGAKQVESVRVRVAQLRQSLEPVSSESND